jgi:LytS/YehU family sensor histidine kinase
MPFETFPSETFPSNFGTREQLPFPPSPVFGMVLARLGSIVFFLLAFIISSSISIVNELFSAWAKQKEIEVEKSNAELAFLQSQVNPHFLFNTLYSIYSLALNKSDKAPEAILKLSDMMRFVLTEAQVDFIPIEKEIDYIKKYIELQQLRISEKTKVNFEVNGDYMNKQIAPLLLVPFVENAFKYGVSSHYATTIDIVLNLSPSSLAFMVANNTFDRKDKNEKNHIGIENVKKRLQLFYRNKHSIEIMEKENRFVVSLKITQL